jgi:hypothetical protein
MKHSTKNAAERRDNTTTAEPTELAATWTEAEAAASASTAPAPGTWEHAEALWGGLSWDEAEAEATRRASGG